MFKFNFSSDFPDSNSQEKPSETQTEVEKIAVTGGEGREIEITDHYFENIQQYRDNSFRTTAVHEYHLVNFRNVEDSIVNSLDDTQYEALKTAIKENSDVISGVYEGGLKVWECTLDLLEYLENNHVDFTGLNVLDLGCGTGLLGILALNKGASSVHFQDYNPEVLELVTIPNVVMNTKSDCKDKVKFISGDWGSLSNMLGKYDIILTSETIYNPENYLKLLRLFETTVKNTNSVIFIAAKHHYFGVGGDLNQFENLLTRDGKWQTSVCYSSEEGVKRKVLKVSRRCDENKIAADSILL